MLFEKITRDMQFLTDCLKTVLTDLGENKLVDLLNQELNGHKTVAADAELEEKYIQAQSIYLQLMNLVEENATVHYRRKLVDQSGMQAIRGSWADTFERWKQQGLSENQMLEIIRQVKVSPVLTAHPTEAKRLSILELHRDIYLVLVKLENPNFSNIERNTLKDEITALIERWWRSGEVYLEKPTVAAERNNVMHYFTKAFPKALAQSDIQLRQSWIEAGFDKNALKNPEDFPQVQFGSWVGGDRDGHPYVTAELTGETLSAHRQAALALIREQLVELAADMSFSAIRNPVPPLLTSEIQKREAQFGEAGKKAVLRNQYEPWRQILNLFLLKLDNTMQDNLSDEGMHYSDPDELLNDLKILRDSLHAIGAGRVAENLLFPVERQVQFFGFHLAKLDVRQNSAFHDKALTQILKTVNPDLPDYSTWEEAERIRFLSEELKSERPFGIAGKSFGPEADKVLDSYRAVKAHTDKYGSKGVGSSIVSMTRNVSDLLAVYLFIREAGLSNEVFQVVPLFETIEDLMHSHGIMDEYLSHPFVKQHPARVQEIMLGYSDSNKDGGIVPSRWNIYQTEQNLTKIAQKHQIRFRFFHGTGGTISRGGGKYHRFLESMPPGSLTGEMKLTVQGETIAQQFANLLNATYNIEMLLSGVALQTGYALYPAALPDYPVKALSLLSGYALEHYKKLIKHPSFIAFYGEATPIDVLELSKIGSRPARRTGTRTLSDLRAIPWVFSWSQSRFNLTGWFGMGTALKKLREAHPEEYGQLKAFANTWPLLRYILIQLETNLMNAHPGLMRAYADLVKDESVRKSIYDLILSEHTESLDEVAAMFDRPREKRRVSQLDNLQRREKALLALHRLQIENLEIWRKKKESGSEEADLLVKRLLGITTALASGLKNTG